MQADITRAAFIAQLIINRPSADPFAMADELERRREAPWRDPLVLLRRSVAIEEFSQNHMDACSDCTSPKSLCPIGRRLHELARETGCMALGLPYPLPEEDGDAS